MKIITFDVSNAACSLVVCPNGHSIMIDCGCHEEKNCPVDHINSMRQPGGYLSGMKVWQTPNGNQYPLTMLDISHPDADHVKNSQAVKEKLTPYLLSRRLIDEFPKEEQDATHEYYKDELCIPYRDFSLPQPQWGFEENYVFDIPMNEILASEIMRPKLRNNASRVRLLGYKGFRILFGGDMETEGWEWLIDNNRLGFADIIKKGVTVLVAAHHGHKSGFSSKLFSAMGNPQLSILSKGSETDGETDVSSRYSELSEGVKVRQIGSAEVKVRSSVSTRSNGNIFIEVEPESYFVYVEKNL